MTIMHSCMMMQITSHQNTILSNHVMDNLDNDSIDDDQEYDCKQEHDGDLLDYLSEENDINTNDNESDDDAICNDNDGQCLTAVSKLQIRLNNLINHHEAPLQMYDNIVT